MGGLKFSTLFLGGQQQGFLYWAVRGSSALTGQKLLIPPTGKSLPSRHPHQIFIPPPPPPKVHPPPPQPTKFLLKLFFGE